MEQDKRSTANEMERSKASYTTLEQLLISKGDVVVSLNHENQIVSTVNQGNQQRASGMVETLRKLLQAKTNETELLKENMELLLANEGRRNETLEQENQLFKQERLRQRATIQNTRPSNNNSSSTNSNPTQHEQHDNSYNDINYKPEYSDTEESDCDDINYDTPSEDEGSNSDLNDDGINQLKKYYLNKRVYIKLLTQILVATCKLQPGILMPYFYQFSLKNYKLSSNLDKIDILMAIII